MAMLFEGLFDDQGTVKWFIRDQGFGFIQPCDGGKDAFVHIDAVERAGHQSPDRSQKIQFDLVTDGRSGKLSRREPRAGRLIGLRCAQSGGESEGRPRGESRRGLLLWLRTGQILRRAGECCSSTAAPCSSSRGGRS